jgi:hypothetical protein
VVNQLADTAVHKTYGDFQAGLMLYPTPMGAINSLYAATAPETAQLNGKVCLLFT